MRRRFAAWSAPRSGVRYGILQGKGILFGAVESLELYPPRGFVGAMGPLAHCIRAGRHSDQRRRLSRAGLAHTKGYYTRYMFMTSNAKKLPHGPRLYPAVDFFIFQS